MDMRFPTIFGHASFGDTRFIDSTDVGNVRTVGSVVCAICVSSVGSVGSVAGWGLVVPFGTSDMAITLPAAASSSGAAESG